MTDAIRIIKKYPNRRLYDTKTSAYITLSDVKDLVFTFENFKVVEAKTDEDITHSILLQIILEEETGGIPLFTTDLLSQVIRFYGHAMQGALGKYLETNIKAFVEFQHRLQEHSNSLYGDNHPMNAELWAQFLNFQGPAMQSMMSAYMDQSQKMLQTMQEQIKSQTRTMFTGFQFPNYGEIGQSAGMPSPLHEKPAGQKNERDAGAAGATKKTSAAPTREETAKPAVGKSAVKPRTPQR